MWPAVGRAGRSQKRRSFTLAHNVWSDAIIAAAEAGVARHQLFHARHQLGVRTEPGDGNHRLWTLPPRIGTPSTNAHKHTHQRA